jgi:enoyl-CoA hydratase
VGKYASFEMSIEGAVASIRLDASASRNALTARFWSELPAFFREVDADERVRCVLLAADGPHFSSGLDRGLFSDLFDAGRGAAGGRRREALRRTVLEMQRSVFAVRECRTPVVAAVQGACIGGAFHLAAACDLRVATSDARFVPMEIDLGFMPDIGLIQLLPGVLPEGLVRDLLLTGKPLSADDAQRHGFVSEIHADVGACQAAALKTARRIAAKSPLAIAATKAALNNLRDAEVARSAAFVAALQAALFDAHDVQEALDASSERRCPEFRDLPATTAPRRWAASSDSGNQP